jgi:ADP-ribose pyrophosphatase YjhB (NUDIX family)
MKNVDPIKYREIQELIPISCVDILPLLLSTKRKDTIEAIGLILRDTPYQGKRWCLIGGRLDKNESIVHAINRELQDALGAEIDYHLPEEIQPDYVAQYFPIHKKNAGFDPRQHAIGLTFCVPIKGIIKPQREAIDFKWYKYLQIPTPDNFWFNQDHIVKACLSRFKYNFITFSKK